MKTTNRILLTLFVLILIGITITLIYIRVQVVNISEPMGSGNIITEQRELQGFHSIKVSGNFNVNLHEDTISKLVINADDNLVDLITTDIDKGVLQIIFLPRQTRHRRIDIDVYYHGLISLEATAGARLSNTDTIRAISFHHHVGSGAQSDLVIDVDELKLNSSAGAKAELKGFARTVNAECSSGAQIRAMDLIAENCAIKVSSGANAHIFVEKELSVNASSGSNIRYKGNPTIKDFSTSGGANVRSL